MKAALLLLLLVSPAAAGPLRDALHGDAPKGPLEPASPSLQRALELYDRQQYAESLAALLPIVAEGSKESRYNQQRATFFVGKALFNLKRYDESRSTFDRIAATGEPHPYFLKTLLWLSSLSHFLGPSVSESLARYPDRILIDPLFPDDELNTKSFREEGRDEVLFEVGAWCRAHGQRERADRLWAAIAEKSPWAARAKAATKARK